jgi:hypothetical protein
MRTLGTVLLILLGALALLALHAEHDPSCRRDLSFLEQGTSVDCAAKVPASPTQLAQAR